MLFLGVIVLLLIAAGLLYFSAHQASDAKIDWKARIAGNSDLEVTAALPAQRGDPLLRWFNNHLHRAGLGVESSVLRRLVIGTLLIALFVALLGGPAAGLVVLVVELILAYLWLLRREANRKADIMGQLPDFVEYMMRSLTAGNSLEEALYSATVDAEEPVRGLFLSVGRQVRLGAPIEDVLEQAAEIHAIPDMRVMAMAARVNRRFGGSLKRIFKSLVQAIRERDAAARELRALTAETRFSAFVLAIVPIALSGYILWQNPEYYLDMWEQTRGRSLLLFSVILQATGVLVIWRMLNSAEESY
jgi:tight adherence protein B